MSPENVQIGQQYYCVGGDSTVWQVLAVFADPSGIAHARLGNVARPYELKTLTCSLLGDPVRFCLLSESPKEGVAAGTVRIKLPRRPRPQRAA